MSKVGPLFEIVILDYGYEPDTDGSYDDFIEAVKAEHSLGTQLQITKEGVRVTLIKDKKYDGKDKNSRKYD